MNYLLLSQNGSLNSPAASRLSPGDSLTILISIGKDKLASELDLHLKKTLKEAEDLASQLRLKNIGTKVLIDWGPADEAAASCLEREGAVLLE
ncbi:MAG: hypothetical protein ABH863_00740 [Candidatus Micrarchaeota archaeon]